MERFVLRENIAIFARYAEAESDPRDRRFYRLLLSAARRKLALLEAEAGLCMGPPSSRPVLDRLILPGPDFAHSPHPGLVLDPGAGLRIVAVNDAFARATMSDGATLVGKPLFEAFPDDPDHPEADGVHNLYRSLLMAADTGRAHAMPIQRYDIRDRHGSFIERYWMMLNTPVFRNGHLVCLRHQAEVVPPCRTHGRERRQTAVPSVDESFSGNERQQPPF